MCTSEIVCNLTKNTKIHEQIRNGYEVLCVILTNAILKRFKAIQKPFLSNLHLISFTSALKNGNSKEKLYRYCIIAPE